MNLNDQQQAIVESPATHLIVAAAAGTGKTRVLVERIRRSIEAGVDPQTVVVITFTNAAAREFRRRLHPIVPGVCSTLHSFVMRLLLSRGQKMGVRISGLVDEKEQHELVMCAMKSINKKDVRVQDVWKVLSRPENIWPERGSTPTNTQLVAREYHRMLRESGMVDYDTMLAYGVRLVRKLDPVPYWWTYKHLYVDEVQDSGPEDWEIYDRLPCETKFLVGDDCQSIYSFRGAEPILFVDRVRTAILNDKVHP